MESSMHRLPPEALVHVLSFLPLEQRLRDCAVVCKAWAAAAGLATSHIHGNIFRWQQLALTQEKAQALGSWLLKHGGSVVGISVEGPPDYGGKTSACTDIQFPWTYQLPQLQHLNFSDLKLLPSSSSDTESGTVAPAALAAAPAPLAGLTALTHLRLFCCTCYPALGCGFSSLAALTNLHALVLWHCDLYPEDTPAAAAQEHVAVLNKSLLQLQQLTSLSLSLTDVDGSVLAGLSHLQQLQRLVLHSSSREDRIVPVSLDVLPRQLTYLSVYGAWQFSCSMLPKPLEFTSLQDFEVEEVSVFEPAVLRHMQQLRNITMRDVHALSPAGVEGVRSLLAVLPMLQQLRELHMWDSLPTALLGEEVQQYTALASSSCLTRLVLGGNQLPDGALAHMLAGNRQLPLLQQLLLGPYDEFFTNDDDELEEFCPPLAVGELGRLALCCPALQDVRTLMIAAATGPEEIAAAASSMQQLTALTQLVIGGDGVDDEFSAQVLAQLTQLRKLGVEHASNLTAAGLVHLTQLKQLVEFHCNCWLGQGEEDEDNCVECDLHTTDKAPPGDPPDVWQQLVEVCMQSPSAAQVMLQQRDSQLQQKDSQLQQRISQLQQRDSQLAAAQGRIAALEKQLATARQQQQQQ